MTPCTANFKHRLFSLDKENPDSGDLATTIEELSNEAEALLGMLSSQFTDDQFKHTDDENYFAIRAVRQIVKDMVDMAYAYHQSTRANSAIGTPK